MGFDPGIILVYAVIMAIFYFLVIAPQRKRQKETQKMLENLKKNDEVVTSSGIHGTVVNIKDKIVVVRVDENCRIEFDRDAIVTVKPTGQPIKPEIVK